MSVKKTKFFNAENSKWVLIDAKDKVLGRLATRVARILMGKTKATYSPNFICGDKVVVINARYLKVTGNKLQTKVYEKYSGYHSGRREITLGELNSKNPVLALQKAVKGMLPRNTLAKQMLRNLKIYPENEHDNAGQKPEKIEV